MIHANPRLEDVGNPEITRGFETFVSALEEEVIRFGKPVLLVHGDTHYFRYDKPLLNRKTGLRLENFTRLEVFGDEDIHWVRVKVNLKDPNIFSIRQELIPENFEKH